jgi:hypothetical protein
MEVGVGVPPGVQETNPSIITSISIGTHTDLTSHVPTARRT